VKSTTSSSTIKSYYITYIYISIQGGAIIGGIRGFRGYRPFIGFPPLYRYRYIYMIDSMILWMMIMLFSDFGFSLYLCFLWLNEPGGVLGGEGLKCVKPGFGGFWGV
jgi:hypothetical protein